MSNLERRLKKLEDATAPDEPPKIVVLADEQEAERLMRESPHTQDTIIVLTGVERAVVSD